MKTSIFGLMLALVLSGCGGGGSSATPAIATTAAPAAMTTAMPVTSPTAAPKAANKVVAAPAQVVTSSGLRAPQSVNLGSGGVPTVVVGYSATMGVDFSNLFAWTVNAQSQAVPQVSATATTSGPLSIGHVVQDNSNLFASTLFDWVVEPGQLTGTGKIMLNVAFGDGTTGQVPYYSYDRWNIQCGGVSTPSNPQNWAYVGGVPVGQQVNPDVQADCIHNVVQFPNGAMLLDNSLADSYGNLAPQFTTVTASAAIPTFNLTSISTIAVGAIYLVKLSDGGCAKVMWTQNNSNPAILTSGIAEHGVGTACSFTF